MATSKDCYYYSKGKCGNAYAPNPFHSWCIGKDECQEYKPANHIPEFREEAQQ